MVLVVSVLLQLLALAVPLFTAVVVGRIVPDGDRHLLVVLTVAMAAVAGYYFLVSLVRGHVLLYLRTHLDRQLTTRFVRHLTDLPYAFFLSRSAGDLMMRLQSNATVREILTEGSLSAILDGGMAAIYLVLLLVISPPLGLLVLGLGAAQVTVIILARGKNQRLMTESLEAGARSESYAFQLLAGIEDLKAAGAEDRAVGHWSGLFAREIEVALGRGRLSALVDSASAALQLVSPLALLAAGAVLVLQGKLSLGAMLGLAVLGAGFLEPLALLVTTGLELQLLGSYMARINDVLDTPKEQQGRAVRPAGRLSGHIRAEGVSFRYSSHAPLAVDGVSAQIQPGQLVAIVGRSGSGKSTLARLLLGLYEPEAGSRPLRRDRPARARGPFGAPSARDRDAGVLCLRDQRPGQHRPERSRPRARRRGARRPAGLHRPGHRGNDDGVCDSAGRRRRIALRWAASAAGPGPGTRPPAVDPPPR